MRRYQRSALANLGMIADAVIVAMFLETPGVRLR